MFYYYSVNQHFKRQPKSLKRMKKGGMKERTFMNKLIFNNLSGSLFFEDDDGIGNTAFSLVVKLAVV